MTKADVNFGCDTANPSRETTSSSLLMHAKAGDAVGWRRLVALYGPLVYRWSRQHGLDEHAAADIVQEVFTAIHQKITEFRRDRAGDTFRGWVRRIATNKIHDYWRHGKKHPTAIGGSSVNLRFQQLPESTPTEPVNVVHDALDDGADWLYRRALELVKCEFEATTWKAFWMVAIEGRKPADVAADLKISRNAVYVAKSRILGRLRAEFAEAIE